MAAVVVTLPARDDIDVILSYLLLHAGQAVAFDIRSSGWRSGVSPPSRKAARHGPVWGAMSGS